MSQKRPRKSCNIEAGIRIKEYLKKVSTTHAQLAAAIGVSESNLEKTLNGQQGLNVEKLTKIYEDFKIEPNEIILGHEYASKYKSHGMNSAEYNLFLKSGKNMQNVMFELKLLNDEEFEQVFLRLMNCLIAEKSRRHEL